MTGAETTACDATILFSLPAHRGLIEGLAPSTTTGEFFLADVHQRCVWRRAADGTVTRFTAADERVFGVFDVAVDEPRRRLWAATAMIPAVVGYSAAQRGAAALVAFDLESGALLEVFPVPDRDTEHVLGDLLLAPDGNVYATDSGAPIVWRLAPGSASVEPFITSTDFRSLQGVAALDGEHLVVSDYAKGLFVIDLIARSRHFLAPPANAELRGIDGLAVHGRTVVAVQNGLEPQRLLRIVLSDDWSTISQVESLPSDSRGFNDLTLVTLLDRRPLVVAQSGWASLDAQNPPEPAAHDVHVFQFSPLE